MDIDRYLRKKALNQVKITGDKAPILEYDRFDPETGNPAEPERHALTLEHLAKIREDILSAIQYFAQEEAAMTAAKKRQEEELLKIDILITDLKAVTGD